jgi:hypothetical protein
VTPEAPVYDEYLIDYGRTQAFFWKEMIDFHHKSVISGKTRPGHGLPSSFPTLLTIMMVNIIIIDYCNVAERRNCPLVPGPFRR